MDKDEDLRNTWFIVLLIISVGGITITDLANKILWMVMGVSVVFGNQKFVEEEKSLSESVKQIYTSDTSIRIRRWMKNIK